MQLQLQQQHQQLQFQVRALATRRVANGCLLGPPSINSGPLGLRRISLPRRGLWSSSNGKVLSGTLRLSLWAVQLQQHQHMQHLHMQHQQLAQQQLAQQQVPAVRFANPTKPRAPRSTGEYRRVPRSTGEYHCGLGVGCRP